MLEIPFGGILPVEVLLLLLRDHVEKLPRFIHICCWMLSILGIFMYLGLKIYKVKSTT